MAAGVLIFAEVSLVVFLAVSTADLGFHCLGLAIGSAFLQQLFKFQQATAYASFWVVLVFEGIAWTKA